MKVKHWLILLSILFLCFNTHAQILGGFQIGNDGHIYFVANNQTPATYNVQIMAVSTDRRNSEVQTIAPNGGFYLGPSTSWQWYWKKGDKIFVIYPNGQSQTWVCPQNDPAYNQSNVPFRGKHCTGSVGCDCPGFSPITGGEVWQQSYCKHCGHKKSDHR